MNFWFGVSCAILIGVAGIFLADISGMYPLITTEGPSLLLVPTLMYLFLITGAVIARKAARRIWIGQGMVIVFGAFMAGISWSYRALMTTEAMTIAVHDTVALLTSKSEADRLAPKPTKATGEGIVSINRSSNGQFWVEAAVNGVEIRFLVDTGASNIALSRSDALRLGFNWEELDYPHLANTPNGPVGLAPVMLDEIRIDGLSVRNLRAAVVNSETQNSLLGMNFLQHLEQFEIRGDTLIMRQ